VQLALAQPAADLPDELRLHPGVVADEHALEPQPLADGQREIAGTGRRDGVVVLGDRPAQRHTAMDVERADRCLQVIAADIVEVDVDSVGRGLLQLLGDRAALVVEGGRRSRTSRSEG
jgi:hypothetical protein